MVNQRYAAFSALMLAALAISAPAQNGSQAGVAGALPDGKIAVINTAVFQERILELRQKYEAVNTRYQDRYKALQGLDQQVRQLEQEIAQQGQVLTPDKLQEKRDQLENLKRRGKRDMEDFEAEYGKEIDTATKPVRDKLGQFVQNYATQRGIILIIRLPEAIQSGTLAYSSPGVDITEDFITEYNKANPVAGATTQPARPQTPTTAPQQQPVKPKP